MNGQFPSEKELTLFVGEGDFSFSANYVQTRKKSNEVIFTSCLASKDLNENQKSFIEIIKSHGGYVFTDVDATMLEHHPIISKYDFKKIIFNFPHIDKKMNIGANRTLVQSFFKSAAKVLQVHGRIRVTLCSGQGGTEVDSLVREWENTWKIVELATTANLILCEVTPFNPSDFHSYDCTGYRGLSKPFNLNGAITHVFCHGQPVPYKEEFMKNVMNINHVNYFMEELKTLFRYMSQQVDKPSTRIASSIIENIKKYFSTENIFVSDLMVCRNVASMPSLQYCDNVAECDRTIYCEECLFDIISLTLFLRKTCITSMFGSLCCVEQFDMTNTSFFHFVSFLSTSEEVLEKGIDEILNCLKVPYNCKKIMPLSWYDIAKIVELDATDSYNSHKLKKQSDMRIFDLMSIYVLCYEKKVDCTGFYCDIKIVKSNKPPLKSDKSEKLFEIGHILKFEHNTETFSFVLLNVDLMSQLQFHIFDYRVLLLEESYFITNYCDKISVITFSPLSLYPPTYVHDVSFWIKDKFDEMLFLILVRNVAGYLVKKVTLIDIYYDKSTKRISRCYRFVYQSYDHVLCKAKALEIHTNLMRKTIESVLNVHLR